MRKSIALVLIMTTAPAYADVRLPIKAGVYVLERAGCAGMGSAGEMTYDGRNLSGHYQVCRTIRARGAPDAFRNMCMERQGVELTRAKLADIARDPDRSTTDFKLTVLSPTQFKLGADTYKLCSPWTGPARR